MASQDIKLSPAGLWTAPAVLEAPPGGLNIAEEIVLRRRGMAEPRPGFDRTADLGSEPTLLRLIEFQDNYLKVFPSTPLTEWSGGTDVLTEDSANLSWLVDAVYGVETRKNLYLTTSDTLRKVSTTSDTIAYQTGAPVPMLYAAVSGTNGNAVLAESYVGYTAISRREDANGLVVRSGISGRVVVQNTSPTNAKRANITIILHPDDDWRVGDFIEVYRTFSELVTPVNESYLVKEIKIDSTILSAGSTTFEDNILDEARAGLPGLGATLYTSTSREGEAASHIRPPAVSYAETFNGSLFLSDLKFPAEQIISWSPNAAAFPASSGVGGRLFTGDFTNGSPTILNVTPTTGLEIGQIIGNAASEWAVNTQYVRITGISGSTITMSQNWAGATLSFARTFYDSIRIDGLYFIASHAAAFVASVRGYDLGSFNPGGHTAAVNVVANGLGDFVFDQDPYRTRRYVQIQAVRASITPPVIYATHGDQYEPPLPLPTATGLTIPQEQEPAGIMWSNNLEPEHFQLENIDVLGQAGKRIMAMRSMKNALLPFKEDGLWRVSGAGAESGFRFDSLDPNVRLLYSAATASVGAKVYAWCDLGVYECDENGCTDISTPAIQDRLEPLQRQIASGSRTAHGAWAVGNRKDSEFVLSVPTVADVTEGERLYVFNQESGTWVNWFIGGELKHGIYRSAGSLKQRLLLVADQYLRTERLPGDSFFGVTTFTLDTNFSITINTVTSGVDVAIAAGSGWTPVVGDVVIKGSAAFLVTAVTDSTHFTVHTTITTGGAEAFVAFTSRIQWIANTAKNPGLLKSWGEGAVWWSSLRDMLRYDLSFTSALSSTAVSQTKALTAKASTDVPEALRFVTPRNHARTTRLYPLLSVRQAGARWGVEAISLGYMYMSDRVRTK